MLIYMSIVNQETTYYDLLLSYAIIMAVFGLFLLIVSIFSFKDSHKLFMVAMILVALFMMATGIGLSITFVKLQAYIVQIMASQAPPPQQQTQYQMPQQQTTARPITTPATR